VAAGLARVIAEPSGTQPSHAALASNQARWADTTRRRENNFGISTFGRRPSTHKWVTRITEVIFPSLLRKHPSLFPTRISNRFEIFGQLRL
jgi:hypothetical protein